MLVQFQSDIHVAIVPEDWTLATVHAFESNRRVRL